LEVIIADALLDSGIDYCYKKGLSLGDDGIKSPDFTIVDVESGTVFYWEHCGMIQTEGVELGASSYDVLSWGRRNKA
jgi:hypothetical protein